MVFTVLISLLILSAPIFSIVAFARTGRLSREIAALRRELGQVRAATVPPGVPVPGTAPPAAVPPQPSTAPAEPPPAPAESAASEAAPRPSAEAPAAAPIASIHHPRLGHVGLERRLTGRWTIWLGAITLALSGVFLVKYSIEQDLLGPGVRIAIGLLLGFSLIAGGLRLRDAAPARRTILVAADHIPAALAAAGIADLFATIYAAFALYDFLGPLPAFVLLAAVAAVAVGLSLLFGAFIALLGLAGAFLVPLLVPSDHPSALGLFGYLLIVIIGAVAVARFKGWWWLAHVALAGSALWTLLWLTASWQASDAPILGAYLVLSTATFIHLARDDGAGATSAQRRSVIWAAAAAASVLMLAVAGAAGDATSALIAAAALVVLLLATGRRHAAFDGLAYLAGAHGVGLVALWEFGPILRDFAGRVAVEPHAFVPVFAGSFIATAGCFAALLGGAGFLALWGTVRPGRWAAMSAAAPILILVTVYWRLGDYDVSLPWAAVGVALATAELAAARQVARFRAAGGMEAALAAYAVGVIAATGFALTMTLRHAWLSVALAAALPGIAWVAGETRVAALRRVALGLAGTVLVRLLLNPSILDYPVDDGLFVNWLLYGYGIPAAAFAVAARSFRRDGDDLLVVVLEGGAIALALALVSLELHQLFGNGDLANPHYGFAEAAWQGAAWGAAALLLLYRAGARPRPVLVWAWRLVAAVAALHIVLVGWLALNPLLSAVAVGETPVFNLLLPAYAIPAILAALIRREAERQGEALAATIAGGLAFALGFAALSLELRQWFHGGILSIFSASSSDAETYAYSVVWLLYGGALLALGIWRVQPMLRLAALALLTLTVAKAFLFDMANLTGLYRAASFLGLGLCLIGIGSLYQRVVFPPPAARREASA